MRGVVNVARGTTTFDADGPVQRINAHATKLREIDHQTVVTAAEPGTVVTAPADGEQQTLFAGEVDRGDDVCHVRGARNQRGPFVDHAVVEGTCLVVVRVCRANHPPAQTLLECRR